MAPRPSQRVEFSVLARNVRVECKGMASHALVASTYGALRDPSGTTRLDYKVGSRGDPPRFFIRRAGKLPMRAADDGEFLSVLDGELLVDLQRLRPDLYFLHGAVVELAGTAFLLVAPSGSGKSVTTWGLMHHGFRYLSDELAPIELSTLTVHPFPRALCLKREPPGAFPLPDGALRTSRAFHIRVTERWRGPGPLRLGGIFLPRHDPGAAGASIEEVSRARAGAHLYECALNALAHEGDGLDGAIHIAASCPTFRLVSSDVVASCSLIRRTADRLLGR